MDMVTFLKCIIYFILLINYRKFIAIVIKKLTFMKLD